MARIFMDALIRICADFACVAETESAPWFEPFVKQIPH
jgi:hypothetical protein